MINPNGRTLASMERASLDGYFIGRSEFLEVKQLTNDMKTWGSDTLEIRCHVFDSLFNQPSVLCEALSKMQSQRYEFNWKISIPENPEWTRKIKCLFQEDIPFDITLTLSDEIIYIKFEKLRNLLSEIFEIKISIENDKGCHICLKSPTYLFKSSEFETSFEKKQLECETGFPSTNSFELKCTAYISDGSLASKFVSYSHEYSSDEVFSKSVMPLQKDLRGMLSNKKHCDIKLRVENEIIPVHKGLLSARSSVFSAMFDQPMQESQTGIVDIPDVESKTMQSFLEFTYTDTIPTTDCEDILKLMLVADKYQVNILRDQCSEILISKLSLENVCEVISVAEMVDQLNLKQFALNYIKTNKRVILLFPDWSEWMEEDMKLAIEILTKLSLD